MDPLLRFGISNLINQLRYYSLISPFCPEIPFIHLAVRKENDEFRFNLKSGKKNKVDSFFPGINSINSNLFLSFADGEDSTCYPKTREMKRVPFALYHLFLK